MFKVSDASGYAQIRIIILSLLLEVGCCSPSASAPAFSQARPVVEFSIVTLNISHGRKAKLTVVSWHLDYVSVEA